MCSKISKNNSDLAQPQARNDLLKQAVYQGNVKDLTKLNPSTEESSELLLDAATTSLDVCKFLVEHRADVNKQGGMLDNSPLQNAISSANVDIISYLIAKKANVNSTNNQGSTPLHTAVSGEQAQAKIVKILIDNSANKDTKDNLGFAAIKYNNRNESKEEKEKINNLLSS